jgi:hypothetical protein
VLVKEHVDAILSRQYPEASPGLVAKVQALVESLMPTLAPEEADRLSERFRWAFMLSESVSLTPKRAARESLEEIAGKTWFGRYLEYTQESESPTSFHFGAALSAVAAGLGRSPRIVWEATPLYPNMYVLLIGPTGARKGSAIKRALHVVGTVMEPFLLPNEGTHQGFAHALKLRGEETGKSEGYIVVPELLTMMKMDHNTKRLVQWFTDWYDCGDTWERGLRGEVEYKLVNVCVNFIGATNIAWARDLPPDAVTGGYLPRHLTFFADTPRQRCAFPKFDTRLEAELMAELGKLRVAARPEAVRFSAEARDYIARWYEIELAHEYARCDDEQFLAWLDRKQAHLMKTAVVWQFVEAGPAKEIQVEFVHQARRVVDWCDDSVRTVYGALGVTREGQAADDVVRLLRRYRELRQSRVIRGLRNKHKAFQIKEALDTLEKAGEATRTVDPVYGVVWRIKE